MKYKYVWVCLGTMIMMMPLQTRLYNCDHQYHETIMIVLQEHDDEMMIIIKRLPS